MLDISIHPQTAIVSANTYSETTHATKIKSEGQYGFTAFEITFFTHNREVADELAAVLLKLFPAPEPEPVHDPDFDEVIF
jgi:hypothetical protein